jgi:galactokinase
MEPDPLILAAQDAEWYTGSRCGVSDQAAMILGNRDTIIRVALFRNDLDTSQARRIALPVELRVLVINSYTERSLSGAHTIDYTRNRFAYSLALAVLRQEMAAQGLPHHLVAEADRLSRLSMDTFEQMGGTETFLKLLQAIPEEISLDELRGKYEIPNFDTVYDQYFGTTSENLRPKTIGLRGPLLFGVAESERARLFADAIEAGDYSRAGHLMSIGHDGDRRISANGLPYTYDVSDAAVDRLVASGTPLEDCPGVYGASSPALDTLVDAALEGGALGASLTGAGIAGAILALCRAEDADRVAESVRNRLAAPDYVGVAGREAPLTDNELAAAVVVNHATAPAGELLF